ncbi:hypothetical protein JTY60_01705 [symbiont of Argiope bruennichi]|uniref:hypothetical protein n=1 Tax=symbiont of Argiope bruennichi TaxID=2810479 RepID=UPI003DA2682D
MKKFNLLILTTMGLFCFSSLNLNFEKNNLNQQNSNLKSKVKGNFNESYSKNYLQFLRKIKNNTIYQNVSLFHSVNNSYLLFSSVNNNYVNVFNKTTKSSFSLYFSNNNFSINDNIKNNYRYLTSTLTNKLNLKDTKNYDENIQNFVYQSDDSFTFNGSVISSDQQSERSFYGIVKNKNLINFNVNYFDKNSTGLGFWAIFGIVIAAIIIVILIACGLYALAGSFSAFADAGAAGAGGLAGAEGGFEGAGSAGGFAEAEGGFAGAEGAEAGVSGAGAIGVEDSIWNFFIDYSKLEAYGIYLNEFETPFFSPVGEIATTEL